MKAFFGKIWAWVLAHKVLAAIIAGATVVVLTVAIVVPVSVSASRKKKAAQEQQSQQQQPAGDQGGGQQGGSGQQGGEQGGEQGGGDTTHTHNWSVVWSQDATNHWHACDGCDEKNEEAAHTANGYGFCTVCNRYLGETCASQFESNQMYGLDNYYSYFQHGQFNMTAGQDFFCRISGAESGHIFELEDGDPWDTIGDAISAYYLYNGAFSAVFLDYAIPSPTTGDGYLYIKIEASKLSNLNDVWFAIDQYHNFDNAGFCQTAACNHYCGCVELTSDVSSGNLSFHQDVTRYFRVKASANHDYYFSYTAIKASEVTAYTISSTDDSYVLFNKGGATFPNDAADEYIYIRVIPTAQYSGQMTINCTAHDINEYGWCSVVAHNHYIGNELTVDGIELDIYIDQGQKEYYKFAIRTGHAYDVTDENDEIPDGWMKAYTRNATTGAMTEIDVTSGTSVLDDVGDGFCYLVVSAFGGDVNGAALYVEELHQHNEHGRCMDCGDALGSELDLNIQSGPYYLEAGETTYFYVTAGMDNPMITVQYSSNFNNTPVTGWVYKNNQWTEIVYLEGNIDYTDLYTNNVIATGDRVYLEFTNNSGSLIPNLKFTVSES
ncbi:MAG: hypothetical protein IKP50_02565 [Bacilli bacterium]|nr:hypothetical protein [Bacilli bacterium]